MTTPDKVFFIYLSFCILTCLVFGIAGLFKSKNEDEFTNSLCLIALAVIFPGSLIVVTVVICIGIMAMLNGIPKLLYKIFK